MREVSHASFVYLDSPQPNLRPKASMKKVHEIAHQIPMSPNRDALDPDNKKSIHKALRHDNKLLVRLKDVTHEIEKGYSEYEFSKMFGADKNYALLRRLRHQFWNEWNIYCSSNAEFIPAHRIYSGIITKDTWAKLLNDDLYVTFILSQPQDVKLIQQDLLYEGYKHLEEILNLPLMDDKGRIDNKLIGHKVKILQQLEERVEGSVIQRTHTVNQTVGDASQPRSAQDVDKLREDIAKLKRELGKSEISDAEFKEVVDE